MSESILQQIESEIEQRLRWITRANGFQFDNAGVFVVTRDTNSFKPTPRAIYVKQMPEVVNEELSCPGNPPALAFDVIFEITGYALQLDVDETEALVIDGGTTVKHMRAAIQQAITGDDPAHWHEFGGNAIDAQFATSETMETADHDGAKVMLQVTYRTAETNPYALRGA